MVDLTGKVTLVTGASRGIGLATAKHLASCGATVVLAARSEGALKQHVEAIQNSGGQSASIVCDVSRYDDVLKATQFCHESYGALDVLVNNAGVIDPVARLTESSPEHWGQAIDINVKGVYHGIRAALPIMVNQGSGTIINISSGAANGALEGWSHYCASKAAVYSLTRCTDKEYREKGIRVIGLSPGTVATDMMQTIKNSGVNPVSQLDWDVHISPEWPAKAIAFLCTDGGDAFLGDDFSIKTEEGRKLVGLV